LFVFVGFTAVFHPTPNNRAKAGHEMYVGIVRCTWRKICGVAEPPKPSGQIGVANGSSDDRQKAFHF
jgi:hypothetical protein